MFMAFLLTKRNTNSHWIDRGIGERDNYWKLAFPSSVKTRTIMVGAVRYVVSINV